MLTGELVKQILWLFTQHVDQHVETTTVRHTQYDFTGTAFTGVTNHFAQHRHQRIAAFQREAFSSRELRPKIFFQPFCRSQLFQETFFLFVAERCTARDRLKTLLNPAFLIGVVDVHIFCANRAAVSLRQRLEEIGQLHGVFANGKRTYVKAFLKISLGQIVKSGFEIGDTVLFPQAKRIKIGMLMAAETKRVDQLQHFHLLGVGFRIGDR